MKVVEKTMGGRGGDGMMMSRKKKKVEEEKKKTLTIERKKNPPKMERKTSHGRISAQAFTSFPPLSFFGSLQKST